MDNLEKNNKNNEVNLDNIIDNLKTFQERNQNNNLNNNFNFNERYLSEIIKDLFSLLKTNSTIPTYIPKKFINCFYLYKSGTTYRLYIYIDNTWKYITLT